MLPPSFPSIIIIVVITIFIPPIHSRCPTDGCDLAVASYFISPNLNLTFISKFFQVPIPQIQSFNNLTSIDSILAGTRIEIPFTCDCIGSSFLAHSFSYVTVPGDTYDVISGTWYANLTTVRSLEDENGYSPNRIPDGAGLKVRVNCSCGDPGVSREYGLFVTYPVGVGESLESIGREFGFGDLGLLRRFNGGRMNFSVGDIVFIPTKGMGSLASGPAIGEDGFIALAEI